MGGKIHKFFRGIIYIAAFYLIFLTLTGLEASILNFGFLFAAAVATSILMDIFHISYDKLNVELSDAFTAFFYLAFGGKTALIYEVILIFVVTLFNHFFYQKSSFVLNRLPFNVSMFAIATFGAFWTADFSKDFLPANSFFSLEAKAFIFVFFYLLLNISLYLLDRTLEQKKSQTLNLESIKILLVNGLVSLLLSLTMFEIFKYVGQIGVLLVFGILYFLHHSLYLYFKHKRTNQGIKSLLTITEDIVKYGDFELKCRNLITKLQDIIPYQVASFYIFDLECNDFVYPIAYHAPKDFDIGELYLNLRQDSKSYKILARGLPYISKSVNQDKNVKTSGKLKELVKVLLYLPLKVENQINGVIIIGGTDELKEVISEDNLDLLNILANQMALALHNYLHFKEIDDRAKKDSLTGLYNRWVFKDEIQNLLENNLGFSLLLFDLDDFKKVNDTYGHITGDIVLKEIGEIVRTSIRSTDIACRYGGEEFIIIFKELSKSDTFIISDRIRTKIESKRFIYADQAFRVTISGGIATFPEDGDSIEEVIKKADEVLYEKCKKAGKNKVIPYDVAS